MPSTRPYPGVAQALGLGLVGLVVGVSIAGLSQLVGLSNSPWDLMVSHVTTFGSVLLWGTWRSRLGLALYPRHLIPVLDSLLTMFGALCLLVPTVLIAEPLLRWIPIPKFLEDLMLEMATMIAGWAQTQFLAMFLIIALVGPILEELCFRGLLWHGFHRRYGALPAVVLTSVTFGLVHGIPSQVMAALVLGLYVGWLRLRTGSVVPPILAHVAWNATLVVVMRGAADPSMIAEPVQFTSSVVLLFVVATAGLAAILFALHRRLPPPLPV